MISTIKGYPTLFQSSPTSQGGRYDGVDRDFHHALDVSILAHLARWALLWARCVHAKIQKFQSSPTSQGGRYAHQRRECRTHRSFNPRPPRKVGATLMNRVRYLIPRVSILAHLARWALHPPTPTTTCKKRFQSSPTSQGGRYGMDTKRFADAMVVSILAHLARWALPSSVMKNWTSPSFQSSPTSQGGRYFDLFAASLVGASFQSSPTSQGGRYFLALGCISIFLAFQSSPTSQGGRYDGAPEPSGARLPVSILAHLARWALHATAASISNQIKCFNPRPPRKVGATSWLLSARPPPIQFQSSPTSQGGRYARARRQASTLYRFNPRPPRKVGATGHSRPTR